MALDLVLDGFSRFIVHWDFRPAMTEGNIEILQQAAPEQYPEAKPRIISDKRAAVHRAGL